MKPEAQQDEPHSSTGLRSYLWAGVVAVGIYLIPFAAVLVDERFLKTFWFSHHTPAWMTDVMRALYPFWVFF